MIERDELVRLAAELKTDFDDWLKPGGVLFGRLNDYRKQHPTPRSEELDVAAARALTEAEGSYRKMSDNLKAGWQLIKAILSDET